MDPLQILTRSAKPSRKRSAVSKGSYAAPAPNPQLYQGRGSSPEASRKRKRGSDGPGHSATNGIDFFGSGESAEVDLQEDSSEAEEQNELQADVARTVMEADERKRILRQHKLKVSLLATKAQALGEGQQGGKKQRKNCPQKVAEDAKQDAKQDAIPLYPEPLEHFRDLRQRHGIPKALANNIADQGFTIPTEVQMASLPILLGGFKDVQGDFSQLQDQRDTDMLTIAPTGSGKTLAFLIPLLHKLHQDRTQHQRLDDGPKAVILAPTKELVNQIVNEGRKLAVDLDFGIYAARKGLNLTTTDVEGDVHVEGHANRPPDIVVATPLSLVHLLEHSAEAKEGAEAPQKQHIRSLTTVKHLILDEADVLLDPLFKSQTLSVFHALNHPSLSTSLWSATISSTIETSIRSLLSRSPHPLVRLVVGLKDSAVPNITHRMTYCATERGKLMALRELLVPKSAPTGPVLRAPFLVFTQTIERCTALHRELKYDIPASAGGSSRIAVLHSELPDRVRDKILTNFRKGEIWVLVTTDLLARGVDFRGVNGVVNYDVPTSAAGYVHRVGRTGRAGRDGGVAVTLYTKEDVKYVKVVANVIAGAERARGKAFGEGEKGVEQWLLDALPDVSKEDRKRLKKRGVEERRKGKKEGRIDARGGWEKKAERRKKDMVGASKRAKNELDKEPASPAGALVDGQGQESEFQGLED